MHSISVKELRLKFPFIRSELKKGSSFLIIHKSKPIAQLTPIEENESFHREEIAEEDAEFEKAALHDLDDDDYLTPEEVQYYLSLPPPKNL